MSTNITRAQFAQQHAFGVTIPKALLEGSGGWHQQTGVPQKLKAAEITPTVPTIVPTDWHRRAAEVAEEYLSAQDALMVRALVREAQDVAKDPWHASRVQAFQARCKKAYGQTRDGEV